MAVKSGDEFNESYNGSTGADGQVRSEGGWHKSGDSWFKETKNGGELMSKHSDKDDRDDDHIHFFDNAPAESRHHKSAYDEGERLSSNKSDSQPASRDLMGNIKYFLGFDD